MGETVSFRPTAEERRLIERTRRRHRLRTKTEAIRFLLHNGPDPADEKDDATERLFAMRVPEEFRLKGRSITREEIDEVVYGDHVWPGTDS